VTESVKNRNKLILTHNNSHSGHSPQTNEQIAITKSLELMRLRAETESVTVSKIYREEKQALLKSKNTFLRNENLF
jgi:hypothetical protein